jgi:hypothetical protein
MAQPANRASLTPVLQQYWLKKNPATLWENAGPRWRQLAKVAETDWTGDGDMQWSSEHAMPAAGSPDLASAWNTSTPSGSVNWKIGLRRLWQVMQFTWLAQELSSSKLRSYFKVRLKESKAHMARYHNLMSYFCWQQGGGAIAQIAPTQSFPATVLKLTNGRCAKFFEGATSISSGGQQIGGVLLQFASDDGRQNPNAWVRPAVVGRVKKVDVFNGTIELETAVDAPVAAGDYIFFHGHYANMFNGVMSWCPPTQAEAITTFSNVDRSLRPDRLAGIRLPFKSGKDPYEILIDTFTALDQLGRRDVNRIMTQTHVMGALQKTMKDSPLFKPITVSGDKSRMQFGVNAFSYCHPGWTKPCTIMADPYWELPDQPADANPNNQGTDGLWFIDKVEDEQWAMTPSGLGWKDFDGNGAVRQIIGTEVLGAVLGHYGNYRRHDTCRQIIAGPEGVVTNTI